jgi:tetrapyrrole methylase family protein/MazG family protein
MAPKLILMGTGIRDLSQMTVETVKALGACDLVFSLHGDPDVTASLGSLARKVVDLTTLYQDRKLDLAVYRSIVERVTAALSGERTAAVIFHGHPLLYSNPAQMLIRHCKESGVELQILSGVSSLDAIFTALKLDIGSTGLQAFDVNRLLLYRLKPSAHTPCLIFQIGSFGSALITRTMRNARGRFAPLERYLRLHYPKGHPAVIVECSTLTGIPDTVIQTTVDGLDAMADRINYNSTLYIPAETAAPRMDRRFLRQLKDQGALRRLAHA